MQRSAAIVVCFVLLAAGFAAAEPDPPINGYLHEVDGTEVLHVWGSHYEMGYAYGHIKGDEIIELMHGYILHLLPPMLYDIVHEIVPLLFVMPQPYAEEVTGMIDGMHDAGADTFIPSLGRQFDAADLLLCNAVGDIGAMGCSTQVAWGDATAAEPLAGGETVAVRNLDWTTAGPNPFLLPERTLVVVYSPTDPPGQSVASVTFPGYFACLSCMNESGVTALVNIAHNGVPLWENNFTPWFVPVGIALREAMHADTGDATELDELIAHVSRRRRSGAVAINLAFPFDGENDPGLVLEVDNGGATPRWASDEPRLPPDVVISTNHLRKLREAEKCRRYETMIDGIDRLDGQMTLADMWAIEAAVVQDYFLSTTVQTMYFLPHRREMGVSFSADGVYSPFIEPSVLTWDDLSELPAGVDIDDDDEEPDAVEDEDDDADAGCGAPN
ncbi:MAG: C45 family autoproteolytic acyltransferase/hydrolase [Candidatus Lernaella stagnicola]|nr:C45 family autoproteolytic acyltransferase/hydrolase [Candidatus Lernaella stagnicola]